jgi:hypothetical protein
MLMNVFDDNSAWTSRDTLAEDLGLISIVFNDRIATRVLFGSQYLYAQSYHVYLGD